MDRADRESAEAIVSEWEARTGFTMEYDVIDKIVQKDVNNYVMVTDKGSIKCKGAYVSDFKGGGFKSKNIPIVHQAVVKHLLYGDNVENIILGETDVTQFQLIGKAGRTYHQVVHEYNGDLVEIQRVNRIYAAHDDKYGMIYKVKVNDQGDIIRKDKLANCPARCLIDNENTATIQQIDRQFYIDLAQKRINDFKGIKARRARKAT